MPTTDPRRMICYDEGNRRFQVRAAGIALRDGKVLVQRSMADDFWALPGGRVEHGETSTETLIREMMEELGREAVIDRLLFVCETIFAYEGRHYHEIGFYHLMTLPEDFGTAEGICHRHFEPDSELEFKWLSADADTLAMAPFFPEVLQPHLAHPPTAPMHFHDLAPSL